VLHAEFVHDGVLLKGGNGLSTIIQRPYQKKLCPWARLKGPLHIIMNI